jgi:hypothetical protein
MIRHIVTIGPWEVKYFLDLIDSELPTYEITEDSLKLLELAFCKTEVAEQYGQSNKILTSNIDALQTYSLAIVKIIVPNNVMYFLVSG